MSPAVLAAAFAAFSNCQSDLDHRQNYDRCLKRTMVPNATQAEEQKATEFLLLDQRVSEIGDFPKELQQLLKFRRREPKSKESKYACFFEKGFGKNGLSGEVEFQIDAAGRPKVRRIRYTY